jgi:hypothetical protein
MHAPKNPTPYRGDSPKSSEPSHLILLDSLDKITMFIEQELAKQKGESRGDF